MLKKIMSLLMVALMISSVLSFVTFAASDLEITFDLTSDGKNEVFVPADENVVVQFSIERTNNSEKYSFSGFECYILYDNDFFEFVDISKAPGREGAFQHTTRTTELAWCVQAGRGDILEERYKGRVDFGTFELKIKDGVEGTSVIRFADDARFIDSNGEKATLNLKSLKVTVAPKTTVNFQVGDNVTTTDTYVGTPFIEIIKPENPTPPDGSKFDCWTLNGEPVSDDYEIEGGEIFVAKFRDDFKVEVYKEFVPSEHNGGYALILVDGLAAGYTYNGRAMFKVADKQDNAELDYNGRRAFLITGSEYEALGSDADARLDAIRGKIAASDEASEEIADSYNVNNQGDVDFIDAVGVYGTWYAVDGLSIRTMIASDVNGDFTVDEDDFGAVIANYTNN